MSTTQATLDTYAPTLGDCLRDRSSRPDSQKLILTECPLCLTDPDRERHLFDRNDSRPAHFAAEHDASEI